jgi:hypothetical protein
MGFSPCGMSFGIFARLSRSFRRLFSRAENATKEERGFSPWGNAGFENTT